MRETDKTAQDANRGNPGEPLQGLWGWAEEPEGVSVSLAGRGESDRASDWP